MTTKERILWEALELFAKQGYEAVSMRDIGAAVGIRESSIYKHYAGKQAIMDAIVERAGEEMQGIFLELGVPDIEVWQEAEQTTGQTREQMEAQAAESAATEYVAVEPVAAGYAEKGLEEVARLCSGILLKQRENLFLTKFRCILTIEQYRNETLHNMYTEFFMERQLVYVEKVFWTLLQLGILQGESAETMALQFYAPFFMLQYKIKEPKALQEALDKHTINFLKEHIKGENKK